MKQLKCGAANRSDDRIEPRTRLRESVEIELIRECSGFVQAELLDMSPHGCRIRIVRNDVDFNVREVRIRFAKTQISARVMWTMTSDKYVDIGLLLFHDVFRH